MVPSLVLGARPAGRSTCTTFLRPLCRALQSEDIAPRSLYTPAPSSAPQYPQPGLSRPQLPSEHPARRPEDLLPSVAYLRRTPHPSPVSRPSACFCFAELLPSPARPIDPTTPTEALAKTRHGATPAGCDALLPEPSAIVQRGHPTDRLSWPLTSGPSRYVVETRGPHARAGGGRPAFVRQIPAKLVGRLNLPLRRHARGLSSCLRVLPAVRVESARSPSSPQPELGPLRSPPVVTRV